MKANTQINQQLYNALLEDFLNDRLSSQAMDLILDIYQANVEVQ